MDDTIVIGEGVALEVRSASFISRLLSGSLDAIVYFFVFTVSFILFGSILDEAGTSDDWAAPLGIILTASITLVLPVTIETLSRGQSLGKLIAGIRIVRDDGGPIRFRQALVRALLGIFELWLTFGVIAIITSMLNAKGKRLGDISAGTYGLRIRAKASAAKPVLMPPHLAHWASMCDLRKLPDGLALAVRQFLSRADRLAPAARHQLGQQLAAKVEHYVAPGPPLGTHPEVFLTAVLAERRQREWAFNSRQIHQGGQQSAIIHRLPYSIPDPVE